MQRATLSSVETSLGGWIPALLRLKITGDGFVDAGEDDIELDPAGQGQAAQAIKPPAIVLALNDSGMTLLRMTIASDSRACTNESSIRSRAILKTAHAAVQQLLLPACAEGCPQQAHCSLRAPSRGPKHLGGLSSPSWGSHNKRAHSCADAAIFSMQIW